MQVISEKEGKKVPIMIFRNEKDDRVFYSTTISHKNQDGEYTNSFIPVEFRKNVDVENKQLINIKSAWLDFYTTWDGRDVTTIFINDFEKVKSR